jgi:DNA-binding NtrC family response regulator
VTKQREDIDDPEGEHTSTMDDWRGSRVPGGASSRGGADAGLVLLYADNFHEVPAAVRFDRDVVLFGREADAANVVIPQRAVSRVHAAISASGKGFRIKDVGSHNGIVVSGRKVIDAELCDGDEVRIGDAVFKFVARGVSPYASYRIDGGLAQGARRTKIPGAVGGLAMANLSSEVETIAPSDLPVLVLGETGTGKELIAQGLHSLSGRRGAMRALNCASIPGGLVESELFGHVRGAFSGATRDHVGMIRAADQGTLLLDEIGDMPLEAQAKLLRVLETKEVLPVGAVSGQRVEVRVVGSTHRDLRALVASGRFRADLYARLDGYTLRLPPLRARKEDVFMLVRHWLQANGAGDRTPTFGFMLALCSYDFPYNVRELAAAVKRAITVAGNGPLDSMHLPEPILENMRTYGLPAEAEPAEASVLENEKAGRSRRPDPARLVELLREHNGNVSAVARALAKDRALVNRWIRADGVDPDSYRNG